MATTAYAEGLHLGLAVSASGHRYDAPTPLRVGSLGYLGMSPPAFSRSVSIRLLNVFGDVVKAAKIYPYAGYGGYKVRRTITIT
jgi:hypothetical protein